MFLSIQDPQILGSTTFIHQTLLWEIATSPTDREIGFEIRLSPLFIPPLEDSPAEWGTDGTWAAVAEAPPPLGLGALCPESVRS